MPADAVYVGRGTAFGNPFMGEDAVDLFRRWLSGNMSAREWNERFSYCRVGMHADKHVLLVRLKQLICKDLACWCPLDQPCHADVLLELANQL